MVWNKIAEDATVERTVKSLTANGFNVFVVENGFKAKRKVLELIPQGSEVYTLSSVTVDAIGLSKELDESGRYVSLRKTIWSNKDPSERHTIRRLSAAPNYAVGSVHAVTQDGQLVIASNTGSQLAPHAYGADKMIWVIGTQKIVGTLDDAFKRINDYTLPLENERMLNIYGMKSNVSKLLIINKEINPERATVILVKENLGF